MFKHFSPKKAQSAGGGARMSRSYSVSPGFHQSSEAKLMETLTVKFYFPLKDNISSVNHGTESQVI